MKEVLDSVETAFSAYAKREVQMPAKKYLFFPEGDLRIMPCYVRGREEAAVKCVNVHPQNPVKHELPTVMAIIELIDPETGFPLAVMDGTWITDMRTGASAGVATKYLARPDSDSVMRTADLVFVSLHWDDWDSLAAQRLNQAGSAYLVLNHDGAQHRARQTQMLEPESARLNQ